MDSVQPDISRAIPLLMLDVQGLTSSLSRHIPFLSFKTWFRRIQRHLYPKNVGFPCQEYWYYPLKREITNSAVVLLTESENKPQNKYLNK